MEGEIERPDKRRWRSEAEIGTSGREKSGDRLTRHILWLACGLTSLNHHPDVIHLGGQMLSRCSPGGNTFEA